MDQEDALPEDERTAIGDQNDAQFLDAGASVPKNDLTVGNRTAQLRNRGLGDNTLKAGKSLIEEFGHMIR